ncbi:MAG: TetR/AcrR family transcriptional regulator [Christensenellales bacterium]
MNPDEASAKDKIFQAAMELVTKGKTEQQITTREIASKAGVNLALVNYYYQSKENLLSQVVGTMMGEIIEKSNQNNQTGYRRADTAAEYAARNSGCGVQIPQYLQNRYFTRTEIRLREFLQIGHALAKRDID